MTTPSAWVLVAAACIGLALPLLAYALTARPDAARQQALMNLRRGLSQNVQDNRPGVSGGGLVQLAHKLTPAAWVRRVDGLLAKAGRPAAWPLERVLVVKLVSAVAALVIGLLIVGLEPSLRAGAVVVLLAFVVWFLPDLLLFNNGIKRRQEIELKLPDALDQLTIAVDAGLGFEAALAHVARNTSGALADEFVRTLQDIQVGLPRRNAYLALAERAPVPDLRRFLRSIVQAEQHGISVARVLSTQASEMRIRRRQRAEEKAMQIPVKVVFPLILFIMPALFVVLLGPAAIRIIQAFS